MFCYLGHTSTDSKSVHRNQCEAFFYCWGDIAEVVVVEVHFATASNGYPQSIEQIILRFPPCGIHLPLVFRREVVVRVSRLCRQNYD